MHALIVLNPHAGGGAARRLIAPLQGMLASLGGGLRWCAHEHWQESLAEIQACPRGSRIVVMGGDGTLNRYLPALLAGRHSLGLVPCGSGNDLARTLTPDLRHHWSWFLRQALHGPLRELDIGEARLEDRCVPFISSLTMGFDAAVARRALGGPRWLRGLPRYLFALARELARTPGWPVVLEADERHIDAGEVLLASVLNTPTFGGGVRIAPGACTHDGRLDLLVAGRMGRAGVLRLVAQMLRGEHLGNPAVWQQPLRHLQLRSGRPLPVAADGNDLGDACRVEVCLGAARLPTVYSP